MDEPGDRTIVRQVSRIGTSAQWTLANPILEDGETGYERTTDGKLLWKIGDGETPWNDLAYPPILIDTIYRFRGSVATVDDLPTDAAAGDVYNVRSTGANFAWTGETWDNLGVVQEIDPAPIKDSGNPVASGGVYAALEEQQQNMGSLGATISAQGQAIAGLQSDVSELQAEFPIDLYQGATDTAAGVAGLVPPAAPEEKNYVLHGDGTWKEIAAPGGLESITLSDSGNNDIVLDNQNGKFHILSRNGDGVILKSMVFDPVAGTINEVDLANVPLAQQADHLQTKRVITIPAGISNNNPRMTVEFDGSANVQFTSACAGNCTGSCTGTCTGSCTGCTGTCVGSCTGCTGSCAGTCTSCQGSCVGTCIGTCTGSCTGCTGSCSGGCGRSCGDGCSGCSGK